MAISPIVIARNADHTYTYTFKGWDKTVSETCTGDATYTAVYTAALRYAPTGLKVTNNAASGKPMLTWKAAKGAAKYEIYRSVNGGAYKTLATTNKLTYTHKNVVGGNVYRYRVIAKTATAQSAYSAVKTVTAKCVAPAIKVALVAKKPVITWNAVSGAKKYEVFVSTSKNGTYKRLKTVTAKKFSHKAAVKGKTYFYKVRAVDARGNFGAFSVIKSIRAR